MGDRRKVSAQRYRKIENSGLIIKNDDEGDLAQSENLLFGEEFRMATDFPTRPNGNLFVVSLTNGAVHEIRR